MTPKEFPPLLSSGFQHITIEELFNIMVIPFGQARRYEIADGLKNLIREVQSMSLSGEAWIDGSFATHKPLPKDVDVVFFFERKMVEKLKGLSAVRFEQLFLNRELTMANYGVDVFFADKDAKEEADYWKKTYGLSRDKNSQKGIFVINF